VPSFFPTRAFFLQHFAFLDTQDIDNKESLFNELTHQIFTMLRLLNHFISIAIIDMSWRGWFRVMALWQVVVHIILII
jgi:hypothetical protein